MLKIVYQILIVDFFTTLSTTAKILVLLTLYAIVRASLYLVNYYEVYKKYRIARAVHKEKLDRSIHQIKWILEDHPLTPDVKAFLEVSDATDLIEGLREKRIKSVEILVYYLERCVRLGVQVNAVVDFNHEEALEMAKMCDELRRVTPVERLPPLFGLPCSLKSNYVQKGFDTSLDLVKYFNVVHNKDGELVEVIKKLGCIPFVRSNIPSGCCATENLGYVYGTVQNPVEVFPDECRTLKDQGTYENDTNELFKGQSTKYRLLGSVDKKSFEASWNPNDFRVKWGLRCAGGSSGGEAALVALRCTPLGWGTDAAGSLRTPTYFCGVYGCMTSINRITMNGLFGLSRTDRTNPNDRLPGSVGPIANSPRDVDLALSAILNFQEMYKIDTNLIQLPYKSLLSDGIKKFRIATVPYSPHFNMTKPQKRAYDLAQKALKLQGHEVVRLEFPGLYEATNEFMMIASSTVDSNMEIFEGEFTSGESLAFRQSQFFPIFARKFFKWLAPKLPAFFKLERLSKALFLTIPLNQDGIEKTHKSLLARRKELVTFLKEKKIDSLLIPGLPPPYFHRTALYMAFGHSANVLPNSYRLPCMTIPMVKISQEDTYSENEFVDNCGDYWSVMLRSLTNQGIGLKVGVQVAGPGRDDGQDDAIVVKICEEIRRGMEKMIPTNK